MLFTIPRDACAWSSYKVAAYTLDLAIESENKVTGRLDLAIEVLGGRFRGFKLARADEDLVWVKSAMYCENSSGKRFVLRRVPRADGLTDFKFVTPGFIPKGTASCSVTYGFDPVLHSALTVVTGTGTGQEEGRFGFSYKTPGLPLAAEDWVVTVHFPLEAGKDDVTLGELTAEEYSVERFPMALTMKRFRPPAYYTGSIEIYFSQDLLAVDDGRSPEGERTGILHLEKFIGVANDEGTEGTESLWMFGLLALLTMALILLKHRAALDADRMGGVSHPHMLLPGAGLLVRFSLTCSALVLYVVLSAAGHLESSLLALTTAFALNLRAGIVIGSAGGSDRGEWRKVDRDELRELLARALCRDGKARLYLDATTWQGASLLLLVSAGLVSLHGLVLVPAGQQDAGLVGAACILTSYTFFTSTRLSGAPHLSSRGYGRLETLARSLKDLSSEPELFMRAPDEEDPWPQIRLRIPVSGSAGMGNAIVEAGVEWMRGPWGMKMSYALIIRLGARAGALVADAPWLTNAEVHSRPEQGQTAIVVRTRDAQLADHLVHRLEQILTRPPVTLSMSCAIEMLAASSPKRDAQPCRA